MGVLAEVDTVINECDAWILKQEFEEYKKNTNKLIQQLDIQLNVANRRIEEFDAFVRYLEYEILELKKDVNN